MLTTEAGGLFARVRERVRARHYSLRTEQAYLHWIARYIRFHGRQHPRELGREHVESFLSSLATQGQVAASTQNQALSALLFLYRDVLHESDGQRGTVPWLDNITRAKKPERLPVVLSPSEVQRLLGQLQGETWLQAALMYGSGLRVSEAVSIRIKDLDLDKRSLVVRAGKGQKDRTVMVADRLVPHLSAQRIRARRRGITRTSRTWWGARGRGRSARWIGCWKKRGAARRTAPAALRLDVLRIGSCGSPVKVSAAGR